MDTYSQVTNSPKLIATFVAVAFAMSVALSLIVGLTGGYQSPFIGLQFLSMFIPSLAVLGVRPLMGGAVRIDWHRLPWTYVPVALLLLPIVMHAAMLPVAATYEGRLPWQEWLTPQADGLLHSSTERGWGVMTPMGLASLVAAPTSGAHGSSTRGSHHVSCVGGLAYSFSTVRRSAHRRGLSGHTRPHAPDRHVWGWTGHWLALAEDGEHLDRRAGAWCVEQLGAVRLQVHAVRAGSGLGCRNRRVAGSSCPWSFLAHVQGEVFRATVRNGLTESAAQRLAAVGGWWNDEPPRLKPSV